MSLKDIYKEAGVVMKPAAMKDGKLYSQQPHSGAGDFNFSRDDGVQTRINKHGLIETVANNEPRLSYSIVDGKVSDCPHLLLEPSRTNVITDSNQFNANANVSLNVDAAISPDGSQSAVKLSGNSGNSLKLVDVNGSSFGTYTFSVFAKKDTHSIIQLGGGGISGHANFNLETKEHSAGGFMESYGNGWYRCSVKFSSGTPTSHYVSFSDSLASTRLSTSVSTGSFFVFGMQSEQGSYATSYIPTSGSTETRQADICNGSGNSETFNDSEGVLFAEFKSKNDGTFNYISISDGGTTNYAAILCTDNDNQILYRYYISGSGVAISSTISDLETFNKIAVKWKINDFALWVNGYELNTSNSGSVHSGSVFDELSFARGSTNTPFYGDTKQLSTFKKALTDAELEKLTSWESFFDMAKGQEYNVKL